MSASPLTSEAAQARPFWWPVAWLALQLLLLGLGLHSLLWSAVALLLYPVLPRATGRRLGRVMIAYGYRLFWRVSAMSRMIHLDADVLDSLREEKGLIIVANHPSLLDAVLVVSRLPLAACIMKASLAYNPFLGPGARLARYIRNDSTFGMVQCAVRDLQDGGQLMLFPEGTRTTRSPINPFHASFALIAKRAQAPVQAVFIDSDSRFLCKGWPVWRLPPLPVRYVVRLGKRFEPQQDHEALCREVEAYMAEGVRPAPRDNVSA
jgi:1-acyl-sn-glycerol-3-phosphate acyltransferase